MVIPGSPMAAGHDSTRWCFGQRSAVGVPESEDRWPSCKEDLGGERPGAAGVTEEHVPGPQNASFAVGRSLPPPCTFSLYVGVVCCVGMWLIWKDLSGAGV